VGITNGSGIGLSVSGQTMTFSNTGVLSIDGGTGAITNVARTNVSNIFTADQLISAPFTKLSIANTVLGVTSEYGASNITHYSGTNIQTISFNPTNPTNTITLPNVSTTLAGLAAGQTFTNTNTFNNLTRFIGGISSAGGTFSGNQIFINGATFTGNISAPNIVNSIRGLTGIIGITNGSGIGLSVSGQTMTFSNTGVLSINGSTGAITNVARTNVDNFFNASQTISAANAVLAIVDSSSFNEVSFQGEFNRLYFYNDLSGGEVFFQPTIAPASTITVSLPDYSTTLAGLAGTQIFTNFPSGISAAGATFSGNVQAATYTETSNRIRVTNNARSWFL
jgi:hypothetical protein